jgi:hypothetical protein
LGKLRLKKGEVAQGGLHDLSVTQPGGKIA